MSEDKFDEGFETPPSSWIKWGKVGDRVKGTLIGVMEKTDQKTGEKQLVYEMEAEVGVFHNIIEKVVQKEATELVPGEIYQIGGKTIIDKVMRKAEVGQKFLMRYDADYDMGGGHVAKTIVTKVGPMNSDWVKENEGTKTLTEK